VAGGRVGLPADAGEARRELFRMRFNIAVTDDNRSLVENSYILILAVKPQVYKEVCEQFADLVTEDHIIVSIMAGVSTASIEALFPGRSVRVVRAMPNLPVHVGAGMAGVCRGRHTQEADLLRAQRIFDAGGRSVVIEDEAQMDAVTAVSGSGPAYFYYFVEAITEAGVRAGLSQQQAEILAKQTCLGAARMMLESGENPGVLRAKVTSPGGVGAWLVEERGIEPHIPVFDKSARRDDTFERSAFSYDHEDDSYICPAGKRLRQRQKVYREDRPFVDENGMLRYRASKLDCDACALKPRCCPTQPARKILRSVHEGARDLARDIAYLVSRRQRKKVEMLFAHLKRILRMDRLRLRGPNGARDEFLLAATAQNLRKMAKLIPMPATSAPA